MLTRRADTALSVVRGDSQPNIPVDGVRLRGVTAVAGRVEPAVATVGAAAAAIRSYSPPPGAIGLDSARALLGADVLAIDRLPIDAVRNVAPGVVLVEQHLPTGELIRLRQQAQASSRATVTLRDGPQQIAGRVTDAASGAPVAGAHVRAAGTTIGATTDERGAFVIDSVAPGTYRLEALGIGYQPASFSQARVDSGHTTNVDFALRPSAIALEGVVVTGAVESRARREAASAAEAAAPPPQLSRQVGQLRVEISGPIAADSLRKLLDNARPVR
jgi:hypothetical protein